MQLRATLPGNPGSPRSPLTPAVPGTPADSPWSPGKERQEREGHSVPDWEQLSACSILLFMKTNLAYTANSQSKQKQ